MIVADTNLIAYLLIEGEHTEAARRAWKRDADWSMPSLWRSEFLSVLATSIRAGLFRDAEGISLWRNAISLFGRSEQDPGGESVLATALQFDISAYDAQFVVVARDCRVPLVTGDRRLVEACPEIAVSMHDFANS